jgi:MoaA/NifB/PqqE/SkfB family radical SAM enzyme
MALAGGTVDRAGNRRAVLADYAAGRPVVAGKPLVLLVELTRHCNLSCPMCRQPGDTSRAQTMSDRMFASVADELFPTAELVDLRGWGESLLLPDFEARARAAHRAGCQLRIVTNLAFRRPAILALLAELDFYVAVSCDGASAAVFETLRRGARWRAFVENLRDLATAYETAGADLGRICLSMTCQAPNVTEIAGVVALAAEIGIPTVKVFPVTAAPGDPLALTAPQVARDALTRAAEVASAAGVRLQLGASICGDLARDPDGIPACIHPWMYCYVSYDGKVGFCDHLIGPPAEPYLMGDLGRTPFMEIWNGARWVALRAEHVGSRRAAQRDFHECAWCYRNRFPDFEHLVIASIRPVELTPGAGTETVRGLLGERPGEA